MTHFDQTRSQGYHIQAIQATTHHIQGQMAQAASVAQETLRKILEHNGNTEWGRAHRLAGAHGLDAFQELPVTTYGDYASLVERAANGEQGVLSRDPVAYFALTSGTTGTQKMIPVTQRQMRINKQCFLAALGSALQAGLVGPVHGRYLQVQTEHSSGLTPGGIPMGAVTSARLTAMESRIDEVVTSPMAVIRVQNQAASRYLHLLFALGEERLWTIISSFPSNLLLMLRDLQGRASELLQDLAEGTITRQLDLPAAVRDELISLRQPNPARARALGQLLEQGRFTVRDIWPKVGAVFTATGGSFRFYIDQIRPYLGGADIFSPTYAASEGIIGIGLPGREGYVLVPSAAYIEFLPVAGADARPLPLSQVEPGREYEIVMTTYSGLTRYRLGDIVRVLEFQGQSPVLAFIQRKGQVINLVGEKTSEAQICAAFEAACQTAGIRVADYFVTADPDGTAARYLLAVEGPGGAPLAEPEVQTLLEVFERELFRAAPDYGDSRRIGELARMGALLLKPGAFERYRALRVAAGASASQLKVPHVTTDPGLIARYFEGEIDRRIEPA